MIQAKSSSPLQQERGASAQIPYTHLNSPTVFETEQGHVGSVIKVQGIPFDTARNATLNEDDALWHQALMSLSDEFGVYVTLHRHEMPLHLDGEFPNDYAKQLDARYHERFKARAFQNEIYLTLLHKGVTAGKLGKGMKVFRGLSHKTWAASRQRYRERQLHALEKAVCEWCVLLKRFKPRVLGQQDDKVGISELLQFLSLVVNGGEALPLRGARQFPVIQTRFSHDKGECRYPEGNVAQYLSGRRLFFGKAIQFEAGCRGKPTFAAMLSIKQYGDASTPVMLDALLQLNTAFISTHAFFVQPQGVADTRIKRHMDKLANVNDPAVTQQVALHEARDELASQRLSMGYHYHTLMIMHEDLAQLEQHIPEAMKAYQQIGFVPVRETIGQEAAFWSQLPGNQAKMARLSLVTSHNMAHFSPLHNYHTGYINGNHLGQCVTVLETPSKTPYYFNFHTKGSKDSNSPGHTFIFGGNGAGKTALMTFLAAQASRYQGTTVFFDRNRGTEIFVRASSGQYYELSPDTHSEVSFAPLQLPDTPGNRRFNRELLGLLCKEPDETHLPVALMAPLTRCVDYAYEHLQPSHRTLSHATALLPMDFPRWPQLARWLNGPADHRAGEYGYLFDNTQDTLNWEAMVGFDMTHFLDNEPDFVRTPLLFYLLHRIKACMTGKLVSLYFDEGWQYLRDPFWQSYFEAAIPTYRKLNTHLVLATQSPESVVRSPLRHVFLNNMATGIYFANPQADLNSYQAGLQLTDAEFDCVRAHSPASRRFLVKQGHESVWCTLDLSQQLDDLTVLSGHEASIRCMTALRQQYGNEPSTWLPPLLAARGTW